MGGDDGVVISAQGLVKRFGHTLALDGLDLRVDTPRGGAYTRVGFGAPLTSADELRSAAADLAARTRGG